MHDVPAGLRRSPALPLPVSSLLAGEDLVHGAKQQPNEARLRIDHPGMEQRVRADPTTEIAQPKRVAGGVIPAIGRIVRPARGARMTLLADHARRAAARAAERTNALFFISPRAAATVMS